MSEKDEVRRRARQILAEYNTNSEQVQYCTAVLIHILNTLHPQIQLKLKGALEEDGVVVIYREILAKCPHCAVNSTV